jgi:hypothetical protein
MSLVESENGQLFAIVRDLAADLVPEDLAGASIQFHVAAARMEA